MKAAKELPAWVVQKRPCGVGGKRFPGKFSAAPVVMVEIPAGLRTRAAWWQLDCLGGQRGHCTWVRQSATASWSAMHGVHSRACLEASHGIDLLLLPDLESEGVGSPAEDIIGCRREGGGGGPRRRAGPRRGGGWGDSQELARQLVTRIAPGQRKQRSIQRFI